MSVQLCAIAKHNLDTTDLEATAKEAIKRLDTLVLGRTVDNINGSITKSAGGWEYRVDYDIWDEEPLPDDTPVPHIDFNGPYCLFPTIYKQCIEVSTIYRYGLIYQNYQLDWFKQFRKELYDFVKLFGVEEVIYLPDNASLLAGYLDMVWSTDNISYEEVKATLLKEIGEPVTDFSKLKEYGNIYIENRLEYFLDDFRDLK